MPEDENHIKSVITTFRILDELSNSSANQASKLSRELQLPKSTVYFHLNTLEQTGYVQKVNKEYVPTLQFLRAGGEARSRLPLYLAARSEVDRLASQVEEFAAAAVENDGDILVIYNSSSPDSLEKFFRSALSVGSVLPFYCTSLGKAIYSTKEMDEMREVIEDSELEQVTGYTKTSPEAVIEDLRFAREEGYALENQEFTEKVNSIAVPIIISDDACTGAVCISGPKSRFTDENRDRLIQRVKETAETIELRGRDTEQ